MARIIYTDRDIEDLYRRGVRELDAGDDVYITDLARERMQALGIKTRATGGAPSLAASPGSGAMSEGERQQVIEQVKRGVIARLGPGVDAVMVDTLVRRVVGKLG